MAENKKGFLMYADQRKYFDQLSDEEAGRLIKHLFSYVNDEHPEPKDIVVKLSFTPLELQLKRDLEKYEGKKKQWSEAGKASAEARKLKKEKVTDSTDVNERSNRSTESTVKDNVTVNGNVNVNDTVNVKESNKRTIKRFVQPTNEELTKFFKEKGLTELKSKEKAEAFINHYTSNGWKVGKNAMKDWKGAAAGIWMKNENNSQTNNNNPLQLGEQNYTAHEQ